MTEELVETILRPGLEPGAVDVFLEFVCYSGGPLPEELLPQVKVSNHFHKTRERQLYLQRVNTLLGADGLILFLSLCSVLF